MADFNLPVVATYATMGTASATASRDIHDRFTPFYLQPPAVTKTAADGSAIAIAKMAEEQQARQP